MDPLSHAVIGRQRLVQLEQEWRTFLRNVRLELPGGRFSPDLVDGADDLAELLGTLFTHMLATEFGLAEYQRVLSTSVIPAKVQFEAINKQLTRIDFDMTTEQTKRKL